MSSNWNLSVLYTDPKSKILAKDFESFEQESKAFLKWCEENFKESQNAGQKLEQYLNKLDNLSKFETIKAYIYLNLAVDTTSAEFARLNSKNEKISVLAKQVKNQLVLFLKKVDDLEVLIQNSVFLQNYAFFLKEAKEKADKLLNANEEYILAKMSLNGSKLWSKQWQQITSTLNVEYKNENLTLSEIRNLASDASSAVRKEAYLSELKAYEKIDIASSFCINGIKGEVIELCELKGYQSPLEMTLKEARLDKEVFEAMMGAIKQSLPQLQEYFIKKAEFLGHKNGLPFYDLFAPITKNSQEYSYDEATKLVYEHFSRFSQKMGDFAKKSFDEEWIDVYPRKGKVGGAFCYPIQSVKQSRILLNYSGSIDNVFTIGHELGHGYHNYCLNTENYLNTEYSMPIAETASTLCENIIVQAALENASSDEERLNILEKDLSRSLQCIVDIYSRFLFEDGLFKKRAEGFVSKEELCAMMLDAQKQAYGKGLDENFLHPYMWVCKTHYYNASYNYYNFPYAYGTLFSKALFERYLKEGQEFVAKYDAMLAYTGKASLYEVGNFVGINLKDKNFWLSSLELIIKDIKAYQEAKI